MYVKGTSSTFLDYNFLKNFNFWPALPYIFIYGGRSCVGRSQTLQWVLFLSERLIILCRANPVLAHSVRVPPTPGSIATSATCWIVFLRVRRVRLARSCGRPYRNRETNKIKVQMAASSVIGSVSSFLSISRPRQRKPTPGDKGPSSIGLRFRDV